MGKSSPSAPAAPDPVATANAQTASNVATANANATLNRVNQNTPWGSSTYTAGTPDANGTAQWTQNVTLSPEQQQLLDSQNRISQNLANTGERQLTAVNNAMANPIDYSKFTPVTNTAAVGNVAAGDMKNSVSGGAIQNQVADGKDIQYQIADGGNVQGQVADSGNITNQIASAGNIQGQVANSGSIQNQIANSGNIQSSLKNIGNNLTGNVQTNNLNRLMTSAGSTASAGLAQSTGAQTADRISRNGVQDLVGGDALGKAMTDAQRASYAMQTQYLDPKYQQQQHDLENSLTQQGVMQNSDAWNRAVNNANLQRQSDYTNALNNSVGLGNAAQNQLFGQGLAVNQNAFGQNQADASMMNQAAGINNQNSQFNAGQSNTVGMFNAGQTNQANQFNAGLNNQANQQQYNQNLGNAQFANAAQGQAFNQNLAASNFGNTAQNQLYNQNANNALFANASQNQLYNQNLGSMNAANAAQAQTYGQNLSNSQFQNAAQAQTYGQNLSSMNAANAAQNQTYTQNMGALNAYNAAQAQNYNQNLSSMDAANSAQNQLFNQNGQNAQLYNQAQNQAFNQGTVNANLANAAAAQNFGQSTAQRNQQINEAYQAQQQPLNLLNSLRTGAQVTSPQFGASPQAQVAGTNTAQIAQNGYNNQLGVYNSQVGSNNQLTSGLFSLGSAAIMASDRATKENIVKIGNRSDGLNIYSFQYKHEYRDTWGHGQMIGVMADEVEKIYPDAVQTHPDGYKMVDYGRLQ